MERKQYMLWSFDGTVYMLNTNIINKCTALHIVLDVSLIAC